MTTWGNPGFIDTRDGLSVSQKHNGFKAKVDSLKEDLPS
jgi:hypothetical protein